MQIIIGLLGCYTTKAEERCWHISRLDAATISGRGFLK